jgi:hypothetical protein
MAFVRFPEQTAIISFSSNKQFVMEKRWVFFAIRTEFLNSILITGGQSFHHSGAHWLFTSLSRAAKKNNNMVDSKRNYFFNSKSTARIRLKKG